MNLHHLRSLQEGGLVAIFVGFGLTPDARLVFGLVRRIRQAVWVAAGHAVPAMRRGSRVPAPGPGV